MATCTSESPMETGIDLIPAWGLEPCPLSTLAEYMKAGAWIDLHTDEGVVRRVRINEIRVYVRGEDVVVRQEWLDDADDFKSGTIYFDSEQIWKAHRTSYGIAEVTPFGALALVATVVDLPTPDFVNDQVFDTARAVAIDLYRLSDEQKADLDQPGGEGPFILNLRHAILAAVSERCDIDGLELCKKFGYRSRQPLVTALWKVGKRRSGDYGDTACHVAALNIGRETDRSMGRKLTRRSLKQEEMWTR